MDNLSFQLNIPMRDRELAASASVNPSLPLAIVGPSGAGKTTLLRALAGLTKPTHGSIHINEHILFDSSKNIDTPTEQRKVGFVTQKPLLFPHLNVLKNISFGASKNNDSTIRNLMSWLKISHLAFAYPNAISGGEQQRVAIARALATNPDFLLLDEPLTALDIQLRNELISDLSLTLRNSQTPTIIATHSFEEASLLANNILVIVDGKVIQQGSATDLVTHPKHRFVAELAGTNILHGVAYADQKTGLTAIELNKTFGGSTIWSSDTATGPVSVLITPSNIAIGLPTPTGSVMNSMTCQISGFTPSDNLIRVALQPTISTLITRDSWQRLQLKIGDTVSISFKASNVRLITI